MLPLVKDFSKQFMHLFDLLWAFGIYSMFEMFLWFWWLKSHCDAKCRLLSFLIGRPVEASLLTTQIAVVQHACLLQ